MVFGAFHKPTTIIYGRDIMLTAEQLHQIYASLENLFEQAKKEYGDLIPIEVDPLVETYKRQLWMDTFNYCKYIAGADGVLDPKETAFIDKVVGVGSYTQDSLNEIMSLPGGIMSEGGRERYEKGPNPSLGIAVCADFLMQKSGKTSNLKDIILKFYIGLGMALASIDGNVSAGEEKSIKSFFDSKVVAAEGIAALLKSM